MKLRKTLAITLAIVLAATLVGPATAGKKKKAPKPYTSEEGIIAVPHTMLYASSGEINSITANEFEQRCAIPASNGLDAYVYEVPKEYQNIEADIAAHAKAQVAWDLYAFFFKADCSLQPYSLQAAGTVAMNDVEGIMPAGTAWVLLADFAGDPATVWFELKPR
jgi:hypothetical protein